MGRFWSHMESGWNPHFCAVGFPVHLDSPLHALLPTGASHGAHAARCGQGCAHAECRGGWLGPAAGWDLPLQPRARWAVHADGVSGQWEFSPGRQSALEDVGASWNLGELRGKRARPAEVVTLSFWTLHSVHLPTEAWRSLPFAVSWSKAGTALPQNDMSLTGTPAGWEKWGDSPDTPYSQAWVRVWLELTQEAPPQCVFLYSILQLTVW